MSKMKVAGAACRVRFFHVTTDRRTAQRQRWTLPRVVWKKLEQLSGPSFRIKTALFILVVVATAALVHVSAANTEEANAGVKLPPYVADLRDVILTAARSGHIEELKSAFDVSGSIPDLGISPRSDPIKVLKDRSGDPSGRDTLAALVELLEMEPAALPLGNDIENNLIYLWPYLAARPLDKLTPAEEVDLFRLVTPAQAAEMRRQKRWLWWRLVIAADGTWTLFRKAN